MVMVAMAVALLIPSAWAPVASKKPSEQRATLTKVLCIFMVYSPNGFKLVSGIQGECRVTAVAKKHEAQRQWSADCAESWPISLDGM
jgi:hypothetical protein